MLPPTAPPRIRAAADRGYPELPSGQPLRSDQRTAWRWPVLVVAEPMIWLWSLIATARLALPPGSRVISAVMADSSGTCTTTLVDDDIATNTPVSPTIQGCIVCTTSGMTACPVVTP